MIRIKNKLEIERIREASHLAAKTLYLAGKMALPGTRLLDIDAFVHDYTIENDAIPAPLNYHGFPKSVCLSVNDCVTHGIPDDYILQDGDIVNIDVTSILNGYHGDTSKTYLVGDVSNETRNLVNAAHTAMWEGINAVKERAHFGDIGTAIQGYCDELGYSVVRDYCGHGIGRQFHEDPLVLHYHSRQKSPKIQKGMVFTIEPMINIGGFKVKTLEDGWTVLTADGSLSAQFEHTLTLTDNGVEVLTDVAFDDA
ncbi:MAG: type I methionyl aminopeptidase [Fibrobacterales bacterium]